MAGTAPTAQREARTTTVVESVDEILILSIRSFITRSMIVRSANLLYLETGFRGKPQYVMESSFQVIYKRAFVQLLRAIFILI